MIFDELSFDNVSRSFYNNKECNSEQEYINDVNRIAHINILFNRHDVSDTNYSLLFNHFISFVNCFGMMSEAMLRYKLPHQEKKINSLFILIGHRQFDGTLEIDEEFFIKVKKSIGK